jgi:hypothetical protein
MSIERRFNRLVKASPDFKEIFHKYIKMLIIEPQIIDVKNAVKMT